MVTPAVTDRAALPPAGAVVADLRREVRGGVSDDPAVLESYRHDRCMVAPAGTPAAVVTARDTDDVRAVMRVATRHRIPVVPRGAGSGLAGGANAVDGCIVLSLAGMDRGIDIDRDNLTVEVDPGVINARLKEAVAAEGLYYPPDPSSFAMCTIGGNVATNAGGLCCLKYGATRDVVIGLEIVRADGSLLRVGRRTLKSSAGFDVTALFVGSEGALGVVTKARLRLRPRRPKALTLVAFFDTLHAAGEAIAAIRKAVIPSLLEIVDRTTVRAIEDWRHLGLDTEAAAMVMAQSDAPDAAAELAVVERVCRDTRCRDVMTSTDEAEAEMLLEARRIAIPALERMGGGLLDDVGVPPARVPALIDAIERIAERRGVLIGTFGHAGDGNLHPTIVFDPGDADERARVEAAFDDIVDAAVDLGGTVTGEHGVGLVKRRHLRREVGDDSLALQRDIKRLLDPLGILNPGKAL